MKIKEAIELLEKEARHGSYERYEALCMAISALKEQDEEKPKKENAMDDLISRQAAIDAVEYVDWYHLNTKGEMESGANSDEHQAWYKADDIYKVLEELPSVQSEQKKGKWIVSNGRVCCSECGEPNMEWNYCPNCGVKME